jgi:hypothetical protein
MVHSRRCKSVQVFILYMELLSLIQDVCTTKGMQRDPKNNLTGKLSSACRQLTLPTLYHVEVELIRELPTVHNTLIGPETLRFCL